MNIRELIEKYGAEFMADVWPWMPDSQYSNFESLLLYCKVREINPRITYEIGTEHHGKSTYIIEKALLKNGRDGKHVMFDLPTVAEEAYASLVRQDLGKNVWLLSGDVTETLPIAMKRTPQDLLNFVFIDADHGAMFAQWYHTYLLNFLAPGTTVHIHDVNFAEGDKPAGTELDYLYQAIKADKLGMKLIIDSSAYQEDPKNKEEWEELEKQYPFIGGFNPSGLPLDNSASYFEKV